MSRLEWEGALRDDPNNDCEGNLSLYIFSLISVAFNLKIFANFLGYIFQQDDVFLEQSAC